ncbi:MAG TPA: zinc ribbon domain-containing protein [Dictyobacter sp.]|nr:zinc ribbon domain-containing protein [Dictyobacter sp.]
MLTLLKNRIKQYIARFIDNHVHVIEEAHHWTKTIPCTCCSTNIPADAYFCTYCGINVRHPDTQPTMPILKIQNTDPINIKRVQHITPLTSSSLQQQHILRGKSPDKQEADQLNAKDIWPQPLGSS